MHGPEEPTHTNVHPDSQTARQAGLVSYANATFTDLLSWLPTRPTRDTLPSRTTDTQDVLLHDSSFDLSAIDCSYYRIPVSKAVKVPFTDRRVRGWIRSKSVLSWSRTS
ncbi:hypothetical protein M433DRAFT_476074 [Acidomyces richmondensis BFW]|nr:hypothetical protein M433DRAFT_476074 [Acidomyces richmondensis BFW]